MSNRQPILNAKPAILFTLMTAFIVGLTWALRALSHAMEWSSFMLFGIMTIVTMVGCGYLYDWLTARRADSADTHPPQ